MARRRIVHFKKLPVAHFAKFAETMPVWRRKCTGVENMQAPFLVSSIFYKLIPTVLQILVFFSEMKLLPRLVHVLEHVTQMESLKKLK